MPKAPRKPNQTLRSRASEHRTQRQKSHRTKSPVGDPGWICQTPRKSHVGFELLDASEFDEIYEVFRDMPIFTDLSDDPAFQRHGTFYRGD
jgi:hypothetical protein